MASRLEQHLLRAKSRLKTFGYLLFIHFFFLFAVWLPTCGYCGRNSVTHLMLITAFGMSIVRAKVTGRGWISTTNWMSSGLWSQCHNPLSHVLQIAENTLPRLAPSFSKCGNAPNTQNSYMLTQWWPLGLLNTSLDAKFSV